MNLTWNDLCPKQSIPESSSIHLNPVPAVATVHPDSRCIYAFLALNRDRCESRFLTLGLRSCPTLRATTFVGCPPSEVFRAQRFSILSDSHCQPMTAPRGIARHTVAKEDVPRNISVHEPTSDVRCILFVGEDRDFHTHTCEPARHPSPFLRSAPSYHAPVPNATCILPSTTHLSFLSAVRV
jgi:hypothetical protein